MLYIPIWAFIILTIASIPAMVLGVKIIIRSIRKLKETKDAKPQ